MVWFGLVWFGQHKYLAGCYSISKLTLSLAQLQSQLVSYIFAFLNLVQKAQPCLKLIFTYLVTITAPE